MLKNIFLSRVVVFSDFVDFGTKYVGKKNNSVWVST